MATQKIQRVRESTFEPLLKRDRLLTERMYDDEYLARRAQETGITPTSALEDMKALGKLKQVAAKYGLERRELIEWIGSEVGMGEHIADLLEEDFGILLKVSNRLGIKRWELQEIVSCSILAQHGITSGHEKRLDALEDNLMHLAMSGSPQGISALIFALKTLGKSRGYIEGTIKVSMDKLTTEQLERIRRGEDITSVISDTTGNSVSVEVKGG